ncbi:MAG: ATP-binding protein [Rubrivivax sp.]
MPTPTPPPHTPSPAPTAGGGGAGVQLAAAGCWCPAQGARQALAPLDALLLAWLALEGPTAREQLAQRLWPQSPAEAARNALRQRLFRLKKLAGRDLVTGTHTLRLAPDLWHDLQAAGPVLAELPLPESPELAQWLQGRRALHRAQNRQHEEAQIEALEAQGALAEALPRALALLEADPLSEDGHRRVMRLHYLRGDRAAAMLAFDRCEQLLKHEVGTQPSAATLALLHTIERGAVPLAAPPPWHGAVPAAVLRPPRLVGRDTELAALRRAWRMGSVVLVSGEAGIGKSRLLQALANDHAPVVSTAARPGDHLVPYGSLARLLRDLLQVAPTALSADLQAALQPLWPAGQAPTTGRGPQPAPAPTPPGGRRLQLTEPVRALFQAARPLVQGLVFDDLHFADDASTELLQALLTAPREADPLRWCLGLRPPVPGSAQHRLCEALASAAPLVHLPLRPLDEAPMAALIDSLGLDGVDGARLAPALRQRSGGNPLFALETLRLAWTEGVLAQPGTHGEQLPKPDSLAQLIGQQLGRLSSTSLMLARLAAVAGTDFTLPMAEKVTGQNALQLADAWQALEHQQVLQGTRFAHDLICETVLAGLPTVIARHLHGEVAAWLEASGGEAARIAAHWEAAGQADRALPHLNAAAERAHLALRERERISFLLRAADIAETSGRRPQAFDCVASAIATHMNAIREASGFPLLDRLDRLADTPVQRARALSQRAWYCNQLADAEAAVQWGQQALALAEAAGERTLTLQTQQRLGTTLAMMGRFSEALPHLHAVEPWAAEALPPEDLAEFQGNFAVALDNLGQADAARLHHERAQQALHPLGDQPQTATVLANHAVNRLNAGDVPGALALVQRAQGLVSTYGLDGSSAAFVHVLQLQCARLAGRYEEALACADQAEALLRSSNPARLPVVALHRAHIWMNLGQHARAGQALAAADNERQPPHFKVRQRLLLAKLQQATGQPERADWGAALAAAPANGWPEWRLLVNIEQALATHTSPGDRAAALQQALTEAQAGGLQGTVLTAWLHLAATAAPADAAADCAQAAAQLAASATPTLMTWAEAWWLAGCGWQRGGQPAAAEAAWARGRAWLQHAAAHGVPAAYRDTFLRRHPTHLAYGL